MLSPIACLQELRPLIYPVVQLLLGAARLVPTPRYFPLRLRLMSALNRLAAAAGVFVPVATLLLEMLRWADLAKTPKGSAGGGGSRPMENTLQLRVSKNTLRAASFQESVVLQVRAPPLPLRPLCPTPTHPLCTSTAVTKAPMCHPPYAVAP